MEKRAKKRTNENGKGEPRRKRACHQSHWPRKILVPVDLSECSAESLQWAADFASEVGARLIVLHVREYHVTGSWAIDLARTLVSDAKNVDDEFAALVGRQVPRTMLSKRLLIAGAPAYRIVQVALEEKADLIILASHCRTGLDRARLGSVTEQVVRTAPCPVLACPMRTAGPENKGPTR